MNSARPEESDNGAAPALQLGRPDLGGVLKAALDAARGTLDPWEIIERIYTSDDTSGPQVLPVLRYELTAVEIQGIQAAISAQFDDDANEGIPRTLFNRSEYPGLQQ